HDCTVDDERRRRVAEPRIARAEALLAVAAAIALCLTAPENAAGLEIERVQTGTAERVFLARSAAIVERHEHACAIGCRAPMNAAVHSAATDASRPHQRAVVVRI